MSAAWSPVGMVGRAAEREQLSAYLTAACAGQGSLVMITGEAGIGKTALSAAACQQAAAAGALVLSGGCYDLGTTPPYGPWVDVLRHYAAGDTLPPLPSQFQPGNDMAGIDSQAALFDLAGRFFTSVATARPLVVRLEDLHWSDAASLDLLRYLSRTLAAHPILLLATYRDDEVTRDHLLATLLPALVREGTVHRLHLQRLDRYALRTLVRGRYLLTPLDEDRLVTYLQQLADGNPFFTMELLYTLEEQRLLAPSGGGWRLASLDQPMVPTLVQ
jgi:predicted ATPase